MTGKGPSLQLLGTKVWEAPAHFQYNVPQSPGLITLSSVHFRAPEACMPSSGSPGSSRQSNLALRELVLFSVTTDDSAVGQGRKGQQMLRNADPDVTSAQIERTALKSHLCSENQP